MIEWIMQSDYVERNKTPPGASLTWKRKMWYTEIMPEAVCETTNWNLSVCFVDNMK